MSSIFCYNQGMESTTAQNGNTLPMVVWLRGDEGDFILSAEEVMATLDIKRSRLTQISGRELRVGRRRVDRYLRPFYRPADVQSYRERTRAAMTRQHSAAVVSDVAADIEQRHKTLLQEVTTQLTETISRAVLNLQRDFHAALLATKHAISPRVQESVTTQAQQTRDCIASAQRNLAAQLTAFEQETSTLPERLIKQWHSLLQEQQQVVLAALQRNLLTMREELTSSHAAHAAQLLELQRHSGEVTQQLQVALAQHESALRQLLATELHTLLQRLISAQSATIHTTVVQATALDPRRPRLWSSLCP